jgi:hypothetical protein
MLNGAQRCEASPPGQRAIPPAQDEGGSQDKAPTQWKSPFTQPLPIQLAAPGIRWYNAHCPGREWLCAIPPAS